MHPNEHRNGHQLSTKWALGSEQSCQVVACVANQGVSHLRQGGVPEGAVH